MTILSPSQKILEGDRDDMTPFFDAVSSSNPFIDNRVNGLSPDSVDVDDIHHAEFARLTALACEARDLRRGVGALVWGEAGIGKSHLLSRLARWAEHDRQATAVYLHNLQASPANLPRSLLRSVVSILTRNKAQGFRRTPLYELAYALIAEALNHDATVKHAWPRVEQAFGRLIDRMSNEDASRAALVDRTIYHVLYRFLRSAYRAHKTRDEQEAALAVRWLSGDALEAAEAQRIGLPPSRNPDEPTALADNQQVKHVLIALCRMALSRNQPFIFCFDQVDNLDDDQAAALSRFLEALIDSAPNLLVVTAGIQSSLFRWRETKVIQDSAWDRLAQFEIHLLRLTPQESRRIVAARVERVVAPFEDLESVRLHLQQDDLFPLGRAWAEEFFRDKIHLRPREVINGAREGWRRVQESLRKVGGQAWLRHWPHINGETTSEEWTEEQIRDAIDRKVDQKLAELCEQRRRRPETLPPDADNLAGLIAALVKQRGGLEVDEPPSGKPNASFPYNLIVRQPNGENPERRTGVLVLVTSIARSTTAALSWLLHSDKLAERVLLVTDERQPLAFGKQPDAKGRQFFEELQRSGQGRFQSMLTPFEEYIRLDALRAVGGMARSGDLEIELPGGKTRTVNEQEVTESHHRRGRYRSLPVLQELLD